MDNITFQWSSGQMTLSKSWFEKCTISNFNKLMKLVIAICPDEREKLISLKDFISDIPSPRTDNFIKKIDARLSRLGDW